MGRRPNRRQFDFSKGARLPGAWIVSGSVTAPSPGTTLITLAFSTELVGVPNADLTPEDGVWLWAYDPTVQPVLASATAVSCPDSFERQFTFGTDINSDLWWVINIPVMSPLMTPRMGGPVMGCLSPVMVGLQPEGARGFNSFWVPAS